MVEKFSFNELFRVISILKKRKWMYIINITAYSFINAILNIVIAFVFKDLIDGTITKNSYLIVRSIVLIIFTIIIAVLFLPLTRYIYTKCMKEAMADFRVALVKHIEQLPISYFENSHSGNVTSNMINDLQVLEQTFSDQFQTLIYTIIYGICSTIMMFILNWQMSIILIILGLMSMVVNTKFIGIIRRISDKIQENLSVLTQQFTDILGGFELIKLYMIEKKVKDETIYTNSKIRLATINRGKNNGFLEGINYMLGGFSIGGTISVGAFMLLSGYVTFGSMLAISRLLNGVNAMFLRSGSFVSQIQVALSGVSRVFNIMELPEEPLRYNILNEKKECNNKYIIDINNVDFYYNDDTKVIDKVSLQVEKGQMVAIVGYSGSGKSTILKLLLGLYPIKEGSILIDGKYLSEYTLKEIREKFAYVPQEQYIFQGSFSENIRIGRIDAKDEDVREAAKDACIHEFISKIPNKYNALVEEKGKNLSVGQKQRLSMARAFLKKSNIILMDEPTSALDNESEKLITEKLEKLRGKYTLLVVAHRLSTIINADIIYVMDKGKIVESGKHEDLIKNSKIYKKLYEMYLQKN
ncbi:ABC transporter ATP-binding protein [Clostridium felsineum]|uniref:ABC transporter ATP-binding protein n=1 Tax=Clostridium felsineum TaxID=36839 RepID=UPI0009C8BFF1|nr:ABC transporter ATP-binding protein [Clostridium felsineum]URZ17233.1 Putative multidrug export ATP-binding/permease protein [Clostridium felsineum DSM 794]